MAEGHWSGRSRHRADSRRRSSRQPLAVGWGVPDHPAWSETVVAAFARDRLSDGLARLHGHGFGPAARVLDGARGDLAGQLTRAGLSADLLDQLSEGASAKTTSLLVVNAPGRSAEVVELLGRSGATAVQVVRRGAVEDRLADPILDLPAAPVPSELGG